VPVYVHSKLMIVDDVMITNGFANLNVRSMEVDSELNIMSPNATVARAFRQRLWRQHTTNHFNGKVQGLHDDPAKAYQLWSTLIQKNKLAQKFHLPPEASLVEFFRDSPALSDLD
jgi:phosphatidylserine/phosphatidylglycerophosphate/cardiolipin synthase-like enzyme